MAYSDTTPCLRLRPLLTRWSLLHIRIHVPRAMHAGGHRTTPDRDVDLALRSSLHPGPRCMYAWAHTDASEQLRRALMIVPKAVYFIVLVKRAVS